MLCDLLALICVQMLIVMLVESWGSGVPGTEVFWQSRLWSKMPCLPNIAAPVTERHLGLTFAQLTKLHHPSLVLPHINNCHWFHSLSMWMKAVEEMVPSWWLPYFSDMFFNSLISVIEHINTNIWQQRHKKIWECPQCVLYMTTHFTCLNYLHM